MSLHPAPDARRWHLIALAVLILFPLLVGFWSLSLGQDGNWDLRNYHWYNAYAYLTGRELALDVAPGQVATYYNPTLDLPVYWLAQILPARGVSYILSVVQGLNVVPLFGLAFVVLAPLAANAKLRTLVALALAIVGFCGAGQLGLLGATFYDNVISLFVLGAAWLVVAKADIVWQGRAAAAYGIVFLGGLLVGSAVGLKQPTLPFAVGTCFAFLFVGGTLWRRFFLSFFFGIGVIAGMAIFSGHWMWHLWSFYQNPLFPYFNDLFRSPWGVPEPYRDDKFIPHGLLNNLLFPFIWLADPKKVGEIIFRDLRIPVAYIVMILTPFVLLALRDRQATVLVARRPALYVLVAGAITYLVWLKLFAIYRYLIPLEMLAPVLMVVAVALWPLSVKVRGGIALALLVLVTVTGKPGTWARMPFADRFVEVNAPTLPNPDNTIIIQTGYAPTSFLITGFPPQVPFLRVHSYFIHPDHGDIKLNQVMADRIANHQGDFYWLVAHWEVWTAEHILPRYGLAADMGDCRLVTSNLDEPMMLCRLVRGPTSSTPS